MSATRCTAACTGACRRSSGRCSGWTRPFLHAERLAFTHPRTGERLSFTAPLPKDLEDVLMAVTPLEMREHLFGPPPEDSTSTSRDGDEDDEN